MNPVLLDTLVGDIVRREESALAHETAIASWGLDFSATTRAVDLLVCERAFDVLRENRPECVMEYRGNKYISLSRDGLPLRLWASVGDGLTFRNSLFVWNEDYDRACLEPESVLAALPSSPDYRFLLEQRARLAEVLYFDRMSDDELLEFHRYVRGD